jgi:GAF domain-containing protein
VVERSKAVCLTNRCGNGEFFGTLCAIDPTPHDIEEAAVLETLKLFAQLVAASLDMQNPVAITSQEPDAIVGGVHLV